MVSNISQVKDNKRAACRWFNWPLPEDAVSVPELADEEYTEPFPVEESRQEEPTVIDVGGQPTYLLVAYRLAQYEAADQLSGILRGHPHERALRRVWRDYAHFSGWLLSWEITEQVQQRLIEIDLPPVD